MNSPGSNGAEQIAQGTLEKFEQAKAEAIHTNGIKLADQISDEEAAELGWFKELKEDTPEDQNDVKTVIGTARVLFMQLLVYLFGTNKSALPSHMAGLRIPGVTTNTTFVPQSVPQNDSAKVPSNSQETDQNDCKVIPLPLSPKDEITPQLFYVAETLYPANDTLEDALEK